MDGEFFPLHTADGGPVENKTYDVKLYGGTPLDKDAQAFDVEERKGKSDDVQCS